MQATERQRRSRRILQAGATLLRTEKRPRPYGRLTADADRATLLSPTCAQWRRLGSRSSDGSSRVAVVDKRAQLFRQKAESYRALARAVLDQYATQALLKLAEEYETRAAEAESTTAVTPKPE